MFAAKAMTFRVLVAARIFTAAALGPVLDADSTLDYTIWTPFYFAPLAFRPMGATGACFIHLTSCRTTWNRAPFKWLLLLRLFGRGGFGWRHEHVARANILS